MEPQKQSNWVLGIILIVVGLSLVFGEVFSWLREISFLLIIGAFFLLGYIRNRSYGLLVPACLLIAIGLSHQLPWPAEFIDFGRFMLGVGFVVIYLIDLLMRGKSHWWPLIPGAVLMVSGYWGARQITNIAFPALLIVVGVGLLLRGWKHE